jgi:hypothetical protein
MRRSWTRPPWVSLRKRSVRRTLTSKTFLMVWSFFLPLSATLGYRPTKAQQLLGWEAQVEIEEGIRRLIAWAEGRSTP